MNIVPIIFYYSLKYRAQVPTQIISIILLKSAETGASCSAGSDNASALLSPPIIQIRNPLSTSFLIRPAKAEPPLFPRSLPEKIAQPRRADHYTPPVPSVNAVFLKPLPKKPGIKPCQNRFNPLPANFQTSPGSERMAYSTATSASVNFYSL